MSSPSSPPFVTQPGLSSDLPGLSPVPDLLSRVRTELSADFAEGKPLRVSRAPGTLDVMGGSVEFTGAMVCGTTLDRAAAVALQERPDREVQVFSFNRYDDHLPFTLRIPLDALAKSSVDRLRKEFNEPGRNWAAPLAGCLTVLHEQGYVDLTSPDVRGLNLAVLSTVPSGARVGSSAAVEVATMVNLAGHFGPRADFAGDGQRPDFLQLAAMCRDVDTRLVGEGGGGLFERVDSCYGQAGALLRMICQPSQVKPAMRLPPGVRVVGIDSRVRCDPDGAAYARTRFAAVIGHQIILEKMRDIGRAAGKTLEADPMNGYLANLAPEDYKRFFRPYVPEWAEGRAFLEKHGDAADPSWEIDPAFSYPVQHATDHHVLEAQRVRNFVDYVEAASALPADSDDRRRLLDKAGHLMYASHLSYTHDAMLGCDECDLLVQLVREREFAGLYGARITGRGAGGTVAVLCNIGSRADGAIAGILSEYERRTGNKPDLFAGTSPGAWHAGTAVM